MKFAFSTSIRPAWPLSEVTSVARDLGYCGIEVFLPKAGADGDPAEGTSVAERDLVRLACERADIQLAGLAIDARLTGVAKLDVLASAALRRAIDLAARLRCDYLRFTGATIPPRSSLAAGAMALADILQPLGDYASAAGVKLLIQNSLAFRKATEMWRVIEQADHPAILASWDSLAAAEVGEGPAASIPILNSRIQQVLLNDATLAPDLRRGSPTVATCASLKRLGEGDLQIEKLINRLRGVGYDGWAMVAYPPSQTLGPAEELLGHAMKQINSWKPASKVKPAAAKKAS